MPGRRTITRHSAAPEVVGAGLRRPSQSHARRARDVSSCDALPTYLGSGGRATAPARRHSERWKVHGRLLRLPDGPGLAGRRSRVAEQLGYDRAWVYDTPQQSPDVWMTLALAADRTERIGLGPGVLVPSLRHPMVNAAATATLVAPRARPGRGLVRHRLHRAGGRWATGRSPGSSWTPTSGPSADCCAARSVEWEGAQMQMLHPDGHAPARPVEVPCWSAHSARRATRSRSELGDGLYLTLQLPEFATEYSWVALPGLGHRPRRRRARRLRARSRRGWPRMGAGVPRRLRVRRAGRRAWRCPAGPDWLDVVERAPDGRAAPDRPLRPLRRAQRGRPGRVERRRPRHAALGHAQRHPRRGPRQARASSPSTGVTEIVFQPCGPDTETELERFLEAARG